MRLSGDNDTTGQGGTGTPDPVDPASGDRSRAAAVRRIRGILGRTQAELAVALGVSEKAVQSYEQGWRDPPTRVLIQLFVLLALYRRQALDETPCWEIRKCSTSQRETCDAFTIGRGQFCWMIGSRNCVPASSEQPEPAMPCISCPVVQRLLAGWRPQAGDVCK